MIDVFIHIFSLILLHLHLYKYSYNFIFLHIFVFLQYLTDSFIFTNLYSYIVSSLWIFLQSYIPVHFPILTINNENVILTNLYSHITHCYFFLLSSFSPLVLKYNSTICLVKIIIIWLSNNYFRKLYSYIA